MLGKKSLVEFASELPMVGFYLSSFVRSLGTFDEAQVKTVDSAGKAIVHLVQQLLKYSCLEWTYGKQLVGKQSLAEFGGELPLSWFGFSIIC